MIRRTMDHIPQVDHRDHKMVRSAPSGPAQMGTCMDTARISAEKPDYGNVDLPGRVYTCGKSHLMM